MATLRRWLIEYPARAVDLWFLAYRVLFTIATIVAVSTVVLMLLLAALGIRWGW